MSSATPPPGPQPISSPPPQATPTPSNEKISAQIDLGISLLLSAWPALTLAVQSSWGGPSSADKRDWFAGAVSTLFEDRPDTDVDDLEEVLLQVMNDEFEVVVQDGSAREVAEEICRVRVECLKEEFATVQGLLGRWREREGKKEEVRWKEGGEVDQETDWEEDDEDSQDWDEEMEEAPPLVKVAKEKAAPEVDDEGFTKVVRKGKR